MKQLKLKEGNSRDNPSISINTNSSVKPDPIIHEKYLKEMYTVYCILQKQYHLASPEAKSILLKNIHVLQNILSKNMDGVISIVNNEYNVKEIYCKKG